jgi:hypothetical protein
MRASNVSAANEVGREAFIEQVPVMRLAPVFSEGRFDGRR